MDDVIKKVNETVVKGLTDENSLTEADKALLRSRATYVRQRHQDRMPSVFSDPAIKAAQKEIAKHQNRQERAASKVDKNPATTTHQHPADK